MLSVGVKLKTRPHSLPNTSGRRFVIICDCGVSYDTIYIASYGTMTGELERKWKEVYYPYPSTILATA